MSAALGLIRSAQAFLAAGGKRVPNLSERVSGAAQSVWKSIEHAAAKVDSMGGNAKDAPSSDIKLRIEKSRDRTFRDTLKIILPLLVLLFAGYAVYLISAHEATQWLPVVIVGTLCLILTGAFFAELIPVSGSPRGGFRGGLHGHHWNFAGPRARRAVQPCPGSARAPPPRPLFSCRSPGLRPWRFWPRWRRGFWPG